MTDLEKAAKRPWQQIECPVCGELARAEPPRKPWVGLTDEGIWLEYQTLWPFHPAEEPRLAADIAKFARAIEAKLKEKNT